MDNDKQRLSDTSRGDDVVASIGFNPSSAVSAQTPPFTLVEATIVDEVVCDAIPFPVYDRNNSLPPSPPPPHSDASRCRGWWKRHLRNGLLGLVLIALGAVAATIVITMTNNSKDENESNGSDTPETLATDDIQGATNAPSTSAPVASFSSTKCTFCGGYTINSDLIITGTGITCSELQELAPTFPSGSAKCANIHVAEAECCIFT